MERPPLMASKRCPHCGQWSAHQHQPDDRCEHCQELLDPFGPERAAQMEKAWKWELPPMMLLPIPPTDPAWLRGLKYLVRGGQLLFAATVSFIVWFLTTLAG
ncbi:hypothetical protein LJ737_23680 [Hymenobacter sp. 15J16-1T3B]|uniref:hypothetical protein n=1 Tax=Hymenobacter sp. 15J16-1T3B TaxID=2886941 RepID=UPI001D106BF0|nr:hypothetical protein [Hymenobacter sp. 15J16-1T3B]MCC3160258.1 hypothetical protein [Hymenobacter sp. 15J16-1T3B]